MLHVPGPPRRLARSIAIAVALALAAAVGGWLLLWQDPPQPQAAEAGPDPMERAVSQALQQAPPQVQPPMQPAPAPDPQPPPAQPEPTVDEQNAGIKAFPPPGTKPIKAGIIVPDGYVLPAGYVRHIQTTDDGEELPPILMFHPDYQPLDAQGRPLPLPPDRVVPPEMAPAGMPVKLLALPGPK